MNIENVQIGDYVATENGRCGMVECIYGPARQVKILLANGMKAMVNIEDCWLVREATTIGV